MGGIGAPGDSGQRWVSGGLAGDWFGARLDRFANEKGKKYLQVNGTQ